MARLRRSDPPPPFHTDAPPPGLHVQTLGAARMLVGTVQVGLHTERLFALLLRLVHSPGMAVRRDVLVRELWPGQSPDRQRANLRQALYKLRSMGVQVAIAGEEVVLDRGQVIPLFATERTPALFERDIIRGQEPIGPFVPGFVPVGPEYAEWFEGARETVHAEVRRVLVEQLRQRRERVDWSGAEVLSRWLLQFDPLNEDATLTLAECTMLAGAKSEAVAILDRYLAELGPQAGDIRLPAQMLRKRFTEPQVKRRPSLASTERHFVGRQQELAELTLAMRRARWHDGSAVLLYGPPGIGKSRVAMELGKAAQIEGYREVFIECRESDQQRPLSVFLEALPDLLSSPGALGCSPESMAVLRKLVGQLPDGGNECSGQGETQTDTEQVRAEASARYEKARQEVRSQSIRHALVDVIGAVAEERPLLITIDDIHWMDVDSWECVSDLTQRASAMRIFIMMTSRSRYGLMVRPYRAPDALVTRELSALEADQLTQLARAIGEDYSAQFPEDVERWIVGASEGNPLMLRALVNHWIETGDAGGIPPTIQALLEQRIDRLHPHALRIIQTVTLLGKFASIERVQAALELPTHELLSSLEQLELAGCLARTDANLLHSHDLVGQAALLKLPRLVRSTLHASIATVLENEYGRTKNWELLIELLTHLSLAGRRDAVIAASVENSGAIISSGRPRSILQLLPDPASTSLRGSSLIAYERVRARLELEAGDYDRALAAAPGGLLIPHGFKSLSDTDTDALLSTIDCAYRADPLADAAELGRYAAVIATNPARSVALRARAAEIGIIIAANTCERSAAEECFSALDSRTLAGLSPERAHHLLLMYHAIFGDLDSAAFLAREVVARVQAEAPSTGLAQDVARASFALRLLGDSKAAQHYLEISYEMALELHSPRIAEYPAWQLAQIAMDDGDISRLDHWNYSLNRLVARHNKPISSNFISAHFCRDAIFRGHQDKALELLVETKESLQRFPTQKASAYVVALEIGAHLIDPDWIPTDALLQVCQEKHRKTAKYGTSDFLTSTLCEALWRSNHQHEAILTLDSYINEQRRERGLLSHTLQQTAKKLGLS